MLPLPSIPVRVTNDPMRVVSEDGTVPVTVTDVPTWDVAAEWQRLDATAGVVLQTGSAVLVAATTFATQVDDVDLKVTLGFAAVLAFISVLAAFFAIGEHPPYQLGTPVAGEPRSYRYKVKCSRWAMRFLLAAVEVGTLLSVAAMAF